MTNLNQVFGDGSYSMAQAVSDFNALSPIWYGLVNSTWKQCSKNFQHHKFKEFYELWFMLDTPFGCVEWIKGHFFLREDLEYKIRT